MSGTYSLLHYFSAYSLKIQFILFKCRRKSGTKKRFINEIFKATQFYNQYEINSLRLIWSMKIPADVQQKINYKKASTQILQSGTSNTPVRPCINQEVAQSDRYDAKLEVSLQTGTIGQTNLVYDFSLSF